MEEISILIAEDHELVRRGMIILLSLFPEMKIVGEVGNGRDAVAKTLETSPDIVIMDLNMPEMNGIEATRQIKKKLPHTKVLIVSAYSDDQYILQVLHAGGSGYLLKTTSTENLRTAIQQIMTSSEFYCPHLTLAALAVLQQKALREGTEGRAQLASLTAREREILQLVAEAKSHQEIAVLLNISVRTVSTHHTNILRKLGLHDSVSLVTFAIKNGLVVINK